MSISVLSKKNIQSQVILTTAKNGEGKEDHDWDGGGHLLVELLHNNHSGKSSHWLSGFQFN